jgi:hypothetical protein
MQITSFDDTPFAGENPVGSIRGNEDRLKSLLSREGTGRAFEFTFVESAGGEHFSPRHRHNFDQIRIALGGVSRYGRKVLRPRMIGYFPEGTYYGPHTVVEFPSVLAALQFDGASAGGYINYPAIKAATAVLKQRGEFRRGIYYPTQGKAMEAYSAAWSQAVGKPITFPKPRFDDPVFLSVDAFAWQPASEPGIERKDLATFGERGLRISVVRVAPGAVHRIGAATQSIVALLLDGEVHAASQKLDRYSAILTEPVDDLRVTGGSVASEIIEIALPHLPASSAAAADARELAQAR